MRKLCTIQKREKLNEVFAIDKQGNGGANHKYTVVCQEEDGVIKRTLIEFQNGARKEVGSTTGVIDSDLLEIVRDRLQGFQSGAFASEYNEKALFHIEEALYWMNRRVEDRIARNVLGTNSK